MRESDDGFVCAACNETVFNGQCACDSEPISETEWSDLDDESRSLEMNWMQERLFDKAHPLDRRFNRNEESA